MEKKDLGAYIIRQVAQNRGVTEGKVRKEIQKEIMRAQRDRKTRDKWDKVFGENIIPTPEEFIMKINQMLRLH